jgi:hypothetical protein
VQRTQILEIDLKRRQKEEVAADNIRMQRTTAHDLAGTPELAALEIAAAIKDLRFVDLLLERRDIMALLTPGQQVTALQLWASYPQASEIANFRTVAARQQNDLFCWAAAIQALFNYNGITWDQQDIADDIRGSADPSTMRPQDIAKGMTGWHIDYQRPKDAWSAYAEYDAHPPTASMAVGMIERNRMILAEMDGQHVVVVYKVSFTAASPGEENVQSITYFDPLTGEDRTISWNDANREVTGWWYCYATRSASSIF